MSELKGLNKKQVEERRKHFGFNEIPSRDEPAWKRLFRRFWSPIPWMIELAALISFLLHKWEDFFIISLLLFVNIFVDYKQESKALNALAVLKNKLAKKALVLREGKWKEIEARFLVPGDIVKLKIGDVVPADVTLLEGDYLELDQSMLTGESLPVNKKKNEIAYSNSIVKMGEMIGKVSAIGLHTFFGKSVRLVGEAQKNKVSHFQKAVVQIGDFLIVSAIILAILIAIVSVARGDNFFEVVQFLLVLLVASIPVALPAVLSLTMAIGALNIAKKKAIVANLPSIEELAGVKILCTDKTGTLTQNKMTVGNFILYDGFSEKDLFLYAIMASKKENNDPIEAPIFDYWEKHFQNDDYGFRQENFIPFNPVDKKTESLVSWQGEKIKVSKGAPQVIAELIQDKNTKERILRDVENLAQNGYRALAVAFEENKNWRCVGIIPMYDPLRRDSKKTVAEIIKMGIDIKMLTGDNHAIAKQIANSLALRGEILEAKNIKKAQGSLEGISGFSQVMPEDKYFIIEKLQNKNHIVAMTGDGVNDAPALQKADVGIAVSGATDAARAASDLILLSPGLSVISHAIKIARRTFERMKSYAIFRIAETVRIILFMTFSIVVFNFYPISAIMVVVLALLNDIPVMMIAYDNARLENHPVRWDMREVLIIAGVLGFAGVASSFLLFAYLQTHGYELAFIQTVLFLKLDVAGHSTLYLTRSGRHHFWHKPYPSLKFFLPAFSSRIIGTVLALFGIFMQAISWKVILYIWIYATLWWIFNDYLKVWTYKILDKK